MGFLGYDARGWGLGRNRGDVLALVPVVADLVTAVAAEHDRPVHAVGWSLGGVLAREAARERPEAVRSVLTLGTPVVGGPKYTTVGRRYARLGVDLDTLEASIATREANLPIEVPIMAIYSRCDAVVAWGACVDRSSPHVEHVEVATTHVGLGLSPDVYELVARRLASFR
ncbi:MAG: alpha/beta hydrolase [Acidimicrobiia bacterium]|nr:alpha/beta hydrolase [Acidimicrobiia bacterium]